MALISTFTDDFTSNTGQWTLSGGATISGGKLNITADTNFWDARTVTQYDFTGSSVLAEIVPVGSGGANTYLSFEFRPVAGSGSNKIGLFIGFGQIYVTRAVAGVGGDSGAFPAYNPTSHRWVRLREASGTVYLDGSPNGTSWTQLDSLSSGGLTLTSVTLSVSAAQDSGSATATFDNINLAPTVSHDADFFFLTS